jgi:amidase
LRVAVCETTFTGTRIHPDCREAVLAAARLLEGLGHHVEPGLPTADVAGMMRAWTDIVACGTALSVQTAASARGRPATPDDIEGVARGAMAHAATISGARYLEAVGIVHAFGRQMARFFDPDEAPGPDILLTATLAEPPARVGRFAHTTEDYLAYRIGPEGVFAYSPFCAVFNASGQPAASLPLHHAENGLPVGVHLAARFGADEELIALCAEIEAACPWIGRTPPVLA